jgi:hypothetical protein
MEEQKHVQSEAKVGRPPEHQESCISSAEKTHNRPFAQSHADRFIETGSQSGAH